MNKYFDIDENALDREWLNQPSLYHEAAEKLALARSAYERAKTNRELIEAEVGKEVRTNPGSFGLEKVTEASVKEAIITSPQYKKAMVDLIKKMEEKDLAEVEVYTLDNRKKALENLVSLRLSDYFSTPKLPNGTPGKEKIQQLERDKGFRKNKL